MEKNINFIQNKEILTSVMCWHKKRVLIFFIQFLQLNNLSANRLQVVFGRCPILGRNFKSVGSLYKLLIYTGWEVYFICSRYVRYWF